MDKDFASGDTLRKKAERMGAEKKREQQDLTPEEKNDALYELHVHQIELEMQNEELRRAQTEIERAKERYFDLYDLAPVGYCTLSEKGIILEANLTFASLIGIARSEVKCKPFSKFICKEYEDSYYLHKLRLFEDEKPQSFELRMKRGDETFWADINASVLQFAEGQRVCRVTISDMSEQKKTEEALRVSEKKAVALVNDLEDADKNKDKFISVLSHELRNPLAAISTGIQILDETQDISQAGKASSSHFLCIRSFGPPRFWLNQIVVFTV